MFNKIAFLVILASSIAWAESPEPDQISMSAGVGIFGSGTPSIAETKELALGYQQQLWGPLKDKFTLGAWTDDTGGGRRGSEFGAAQLGFEVNNRGWVSGVFSGPCGISQTDSFLGSNFQFMETVEFGMQDRDSNYVGVIYRHISDAGLTTINHGRDFLGVEIKF